MQGHSPGGGEGLDQVSFLYLFVTFIYVFDTCTDVYHAVDMTYTHIYVYIHTDTPTSYGDTTT